MACAARIVGPVPDWEANLPSPSKPPDSQTDFPEQLGMLREDPEVKQLAWARAGGPEKANLNSSDWSKDFYRELLAIAGDPRVMGLARQRAGDRDLAEDVIQETVYIVSRMPNPERIANLRAYFYTVMVHEAARLRTMRAKLVLCDPESGTGARHTGGHGLRTLEDAVVARLMAQTWMAQFRQRKQQLRATVPGRSAHPERYRDHIVAAAEAFFEAAALHEASGEGVRRTLLDAYPEWFAEPGCAQNTRDQRFSRAHADLLALVRQVVAHEDLLP